MERLIKSCLTWIPISLEGIWLVRVVLDSLNLRNSVVVARFARSFGKTLRDDLVRLRGVQSRTAEWISLLGVPKPICHIPDDGTKVGPEWYSWSLIEKDNILITIFISQYLYTPLPFASRTGRGMLVVWRRGALLCEWSCSQLSKMNSFSLAWEWVHQQIRLKTLQRSRS